MPLNELVELYNSKRKNYRSGYSLLLMRITHEIITIFESNQKWFEGKENEIGELLLKASEIVYMFDIMEDKNSKIIIDQLKIFIFKFISSYKKDYV